MRVRPDSRANVVPRVPAVHHAVYVPPFATFGDVNLLVDLARTCRAGRLGRVLPLGPPALPGRRSVRRRLDRPGRDRGRDRTHPARTAHHAAPARRPWKVARESVTLDHLSAGRLVLGVGLGIDFWREFAGFGGEAADDPERRAARRRHRDHHATLVGRARDLRRVAAASRRRAVPAEAVADAAHPDLVGGALAAAPEPRAPRRALRRGRAVPARRAAHTRQRARAPRRDRTRTRERRHRSTCACTVRASKRPTSRLPASRGSWSRSFPRSRSPRSGASSSADPDGHDARRCDLMPPCA